MHSIIIRYADPSEKDEYEIEDEIDYDIIAEYGGIDYTRDIDYSSIDMKGIFDRRYGAENVKIDYKSMCIKIKKDGLLKYVKESIEKGIEALKDIDINDPDKVWIGIRRTQDALDEKFGMLFYNANNYNYIINDMDFTLEMMRKCKDKDCCEFSIVQVFDYHY